MHAKGIVLNEKKKKVSLKKWQAVKFHIYSSLGRTKL